MGTSNRSGDKPQKNNMWINSRESFEVLRGELEPELFYQFAKVRGS